MSMLGGFTPNLLYMVSRAAGKNILALSIIVIMLVLRNTITFLRNHGFVKYLPLDNNIYIHKIVGCLIFFLGMIHSACHFTNFAVNIQPDPVKYLQLTYKYWVKHFGEGNVFNQYHFPPGCDFAADPEDCPEESLSIPDGVHQDVIYNGGNFTCQVGLFGSYSSLPPYLLYARIKNTVFKWSLRCDIKALAQLSAQSGILADFERGRMTC